MSDALTPDAPVDGAAVPETPAPEVAVEGASAGANAPVETVPAERFNGLQRKYQSDKSEWENRIAAMQAELTSLRAKEQETPEVATDNEGLMAEVQALREMLVEERSANAREKVLDQYPGAKPFADLIVGGTQDEMEQVAKTLHERMSVLLGSGEAPPASNEQPGGAPAGEAPAGEAPAGEAPAAPAVPEHGGAVSASGAEQFDTAVSEALANKDFEGFLKAASARQEASMAKVS